MRLTPVLMMLFAWMSMAIATTPIAIEVRYQARRPNQFTGRSLLRRHALDKVEQLPPHLVRGQMHALAVPRQHPLKSVLCQSPHRVGLAPPGVPAIVARCGQMF